MKAVEVVGALRMGRFIKSLLRKRLNALLPRCEVKVGKPK